MISGQTQPIRRTSDDYNNYYIDEPGWEGITHCVDVYVDNTFLRHVGGAGLELSWTAPGGKSPKTVGNQLSMMKKLMGPPDASVVFTSKDGKEPGIKSEFFDHPTTLSGFPDVTGKTPDRELISQTFRFIRNGYVWDELVLPTPKGKTPWDEKRYDDRFADTFASRHTGYLMITKPGAYTFYLSSDDGSRLWINDSLVIANEGARNMEKKESAPVKLTEGRHKLLVEHYKNSSLDNLESGTYYFDYAADKIYLADDPGTRIVEVSASNAFHGNATDVTIRNLIIEKYATGEKFGGIEAGPGWVIEGNETRYNHGTGVQIRGSTDRKSRVRFNYSHHNGSRGIGIGGDWKNFDLTDVLVEANESAFNNALHFGRGWDAGGIKSLFADGCRIQRNYIHDNDCKGIWIDGNACRHMIEGNLIVNNASSGITIEISNFNKFAGNRVFHNNLRP